jgi:hypothetical protein
MKKYFQDNSREGEMIKLFDLIQDTSEGRIGVDAFLELEGNRYPFELKTTSKGSVTTVRDFSPDHIEKWQGKHWLFGFYQGTYVYYKYGNPSMMVPWIEEKAEYIRLDFELADRLSKNSLYVIYIKFVIKKRVIRILMQDEYKKCSTQRTNIWPCKM